MQLVETNCSLSSSQETFKSNKTKCTDGNIDLQPPRVKFRSNNKASNHDLDCSSNFNHSGFFLPGLLLHGPELI